MLAPIFNGQPTTDDCLMAFLRAPLQVLIRDRYKVGHWQYRENGWHLLDLFRQAAQSLPERPLGMKWFLDGPVVTAIKSNNFEEAFVKALEDAEDDGIPFASFCCEIPLDLSHQALKILGLAKKTQTLDTLKPPPISCTKENQYIVLPISASFHLFGKEQQMNIVFVIANTKKFGARPHRDARLPLSPYFDPEYEVN
ncbi:MAG: hypothetical protein K0S07_1578 [Chlamydiales bacterium]|jgi:hypothetical protein|nr:hypothetical protein [Chlamydiales bacterium]